MRKVIIIAILSLLLTALSAVVVKKNYPYTKEGWSRGVTTIGGFPFGYLPDAPDTSFDDFGNDLFIGKNFLLDFLVYAMLLSGIFAICNLVTNRKNE